MPFFYQWSTLPRIWLKWNCSKHKIKIFCQRRPYYRVLDKLDPSLGKSEKMLTLLNSWSGQCFMSKIIWKKRNLTFWFLLFFEISVMIQVLNLELGECQRENQMVATILTVMCISVGPRPKRLETRVIIKISTHPCYPWTFDYFSSD